MANTGEHDLRQQLEKLSAELIRSAPPETAASMRKAHEELLNSGIAGSALKEGAQAPDFTLPNAVGRPYRLKDGLSHGPVVVTFYRGGW